MAIWVWVGKEGSVRCQGKSGDQVAVAPGWIDRASYHTTDDRPTDHTSIANACGVRRVTGAREASPSAGLRHCCHRLPHRRVVHNTGRSCSAPPPWIGRLRYHVEFYHNHHYIIGGTLTLQRRSSCAVVLRARSYVVVRVSSDPPCPRDKVVVTNNDPALTTEYRRHFLASFRSGASLSNIIPRGKKKMQDGQRARLTRPGDERGWVDKGG